MLAEYVYLLDKPESFRRDAAAGKVGRDDIKVSEIQHIGGRSMLVLERISLTTKIYRVSLEREFAAPARLAEPATRPTLEQMSGDQLGQAGVPVLAKTLVIDTDDHPQICGDLEGMILLDSTTLLLANDSDFGVGGAETQFWQVTLSAPAR